MLFFQVPLSSRGRPLNKTKRAASPSPRAKNGGDKAKSAKKAKPTATSSSTPQTPTSTRTPSSKRATEPRTVQQLAAKKRDVEAAQLREARNLHAIAMADSKDLRTKVAREGKRANVEAAQRLLLQEAAKKTDEEIKKLRQQCLRLRETEGTRAAAAKSIRQAQDPPSASRDYQPPLDLEEQDHHLGLALAFKVRSTFY